MSQSSDSHAVKTQTQTPTVTDSFPNETATPLTPRAVAGSSNNSNNSDSSNSLQRRNSLPVFIDTKQLLVRQVAVSLNWNSVTDHCEDWSLSWVDVPDGTFYGSLLPHQKVNHFPGIDQITKKKNLARNLNRMKLKFPLFYAFTPTTYVLPEEYTKLKNEFTDRRNKTFIVKPDASCQGKGIFLTRNFNQISAIESIVAQRYIHKPLLIDGLKFDLRVYVLVTSCDPLRIYVLKDGLVRFCTEAYEKPVSSNLSSKFSHLTNYSINKFSENFIYNQETSTENVGSKWSIVALMEYLQQQGMEYEKLWADICEIIIRTFLSILPVLQHNYRVWFPHDKDGGMCYQFLGFDVFVDRDLKPWLLEVNRSPSLNCDTPMDRRIKSTALNDAFKIVNPQAVPSKKRLLKSLRDDRKRRSLLRKNFSKKDFKERQEMYEKTRRELVARRCEEEDKNCKGTSYQLVYPKPQDRPEYEQFVSAAREIFDRYATNRSTKSSALKSNQPGSGTGTGSGTGSGSDVNEKTKQEVQSKIDNQTEKQKQTEKPENRPKVKRRSRENSIIARNIEAAGQVRKLPERRSIIFANKRNFQVLTDSSSLAEDESQGLNHKIDTACSSSTSTCSSNTRPPSTTSSCSSNAPPSSHSSISPSRRRSSFSRLSSLLSTLPTQHSSIGGTAESNRVAPVHNSRDDSSSCGIRQWMDIEPKPSQQQPLTLARRSSLNEQFLQNWRPKSELSSLKVNGESIGRTAAKFDSTKRRCV